jgi:hypothetical protein
MPTVALGAVLVLIKGIASICDVETLTTPHPKARARSSIEDALQKEQRPLSC